MSSLTNILNFFQSIDRGLISLGYNAEVTSADFTGNAMIFHVRVTGDIFNSSEAYATAEFIVKDADSKDKAWIREVAVDYYPYTKDELVRDINAQLPEKIGGLPVRPVKVARVLASQFKALGLDPAGVTDLV